jgi:hypothetical protein
MTNVINLHNKVREEHKLDEKIRLAAKHNNLTLLVKLLAIKYSFRSKVEKALSTVKGEITNLKIMSDRINLFLDEERYNVWGEIKRIKKEISKLSGEIEQPQEAPRRYQEINIIRIYDCSSKKYLRREETPERFDTKSSGKFLGITASTVGKLVRTGKLHGRKIAGSYVIQRGALFDYISTYKPERKILEEITAIRRVDNNVDKVVEVNFTKAKKKLMKGLK